MNIDQFLKAHGISTQDILRATETALRLTPGDLLFIAGSLAEGIGNRSSDLDVFLITSRKDIEYTACRTDVALVVEGCLVDVRVLQHDEVNDLLGRFERWAGQPRVPRRAFEFMPDERKLLYRLKTGTALYGEELFHSLQRRIAWQDVTRHKLDWALHMGSTIQVDLRGLRDDGDYWSMLLAAQDLLGHAIDALLAGWRFANPGEKWRVRYLSKLPAGWEVQLPGRRSGATAIDRFLSLNRLPEIVNPSTSNSYALRVAAFSRAVYTWAELSLLSDHPSTEIPDFFVQGGGRGRVLPALDLDIAIRFRDGLLEIFRLNDEGPAFRLSKEAAVTLCLFDGETSIQETCAPRSILRDAMALVRVTDFEAAPIRVDEERFQLSLRGHRT